MQNTSISIKALIICIGLAIAAYFYGIESRFAPKNGDEYPYTHIVRLTSASGNWLPLQSEMIGIKNTKPPLLFWQGMVSTDNGQDWSLLNLRLPSLFYTFVTALLIGLLAGKIKKNFFTGILAALIWLAFFNTYRYGRPYLAEPPEIFWYSIPFLGLLWIGDRGFQSKWIFPMFAGVCVGFASLYKSAAYVLPFCSTLFIWYWLWHSKKLTPVFSKDLIKIIFIGLLGISIFSLWFILDPNPLEIWNEFVIGENAGKFSSRKSHYFKDLLWGGDSIVMLLINSLANAGLLFFVLVNLFYKSFTDRRDALKEEKYIWIFIFVLFLIFCLPSQRSGRYLLPAMPAIAILISFYWDKLSLWPFRLALFLNTLLVLALGWLSWKIDLWTYPLLHWLILGLSIVVIISGFAYKPLTKILTLAICFLSFLFLSSSIMPLDGQLGRFSHKTITDLQGKKVWFPCDFRAKDEEYRFLLPGVDIGGYPANESNQIEMLSKNYNIFAAHNPPQEKINLCNECSIIGERIEMKARHSSEEIREMLSGKVNKHLFVKEYIILSPRVSENLTTHNKDACR